ncbi:DUF4382 domain-containing protein [Thermoflavifilum thermophilum]|uniref:Carboxypeptidase regulatory-like domain-containing protein n=1 Tax=Thermoflavifilum thermophilum TaxID=1393122 RepID=A0A1I7NF24_9BACT|nr:DUF4382 domain-containing protein [Thermoflavifilum thermophilum]SFV33258.1 Carboxypeptidase regulatory-like domain-containing protein [Thermoflavifilum thermophilum]
MQKQFLFLPMLTGAIIAGLLLYSSCQKTSVSTGPAHVEFYLTDDPGPYQAVWIDVQQVWVNTSSDTSSSSSGWQQVPLLKPGLYNLLSLRNGVDTILGAIDLPAGRISQIRLVLGTNNSLVLNDGTQVALTTPSAQQSGLKLNVDQTITAGIPYAIVLDFDAARSIVKAGNSGNYLLKPVIRTFLKSTGGAIDGYVLPDSARAQVWAIMNTDTIGAWPDSTGYYKFWGIAAGSYQLVFQPDTTTGYQDTTLNNIQVTTGQVTHVDTVWLHR